MKQKPTFLQAIIPIISMVLLLGIGYGVYGLRAEILMLISAGIAGIIALKLGYTWEDMMDSIVGKLSKTMPAILILIIVGVLIGSWMIGGTIPMMVYYGLKIIDPKFIVITSFFVTSFVSICTGTSWGSAGTIGVALMGVAAGMGMPLPIVAGAIVSGAYFGDKMSPLSDTTNLAPIAAGTTLYEHIQHMLYTTGPAFILSSIVYILVGLKMPVSDIATPEKVEIILKTLNNMFNWNPFIILPPIIVLYGSIKKKPTIPVMLLSSCIALFNSVVFQGFTLGQAFESTISGFNISMINGIDTTNIIADIPKLLNRGGMNSMLGTVLIAFCAYGFAGIIAVNGSLDIVLERLMRGVKSTGNLILITLISCFTAVCVTSNGQLSILIPGEMLKNSYISRKLHPKNLSRSLEDGATVIEPLVPWTAAGVYMATTLGVPTLEYLPWAILCYSGWIFALIWGYTGKFIAKLDEEHLIYQEYLKEHKLQK